MGSDTYCTLLTISLRRYTRTYIYSIGNQSLQGLRHLFIRELHAEPTRAYTRLRLRGLTRAYTRLRLRGLTRVLRACGVCTSWNTAAEVLLRSKAAWTKALAPYYVPFTTYY